MENMPNCSPGPTCSRSHPGTGFRPPRKLLHAPAPRPLPFAGFSTILGRRAARVCHGRPAGIVPIILAGISPPSDTPLTGSGYTIDFSTGFDPLQGVVKGDSGQRAVPVAGVSGRIRRSPPPPLRAATRGQTTPSHGAAWTEPSVPDVFAPGAYTRLSRLKNPA